MTFVSQKTLFDFLVMLYDKVGNEDKIENFGF